MKKLAVLCASLRCTFCLPQLSSRRGVADRIQTVLGKFGISTGEKFLSKSGLTSLEHLAGVANHLELNEVSIGT